jgi:hypothetical protein
MTPNAVVKPNGLLISIKRIDLHFAEEFRFIFASLKKLRGSVQVVFGKNAENNAHFANF